MANFSQKAYNLKQINIPVFLDITWKSQKKPRWFKYCWSEINLIFPLFKYHLNQFSNNGTSKKNCYYQISGPLIQIWQWVHGNYLTKGKGVNLEFFLVKSFCNPTYFCQIIWSLFGKIDKYITNRSFLIKILSKKLNWRATFKLQWPPSKEAIGLQTMWIMPKNNTLHINFTEKQGKERFKVFFFNLWCTKYYLK